MAPKRASSKAAPSVDEAAKAALLAEKRARPLQTPPTKKPAKTTHSARDSAMINHDPAQHPPNHAYQHHQEVQIVPPPLPPPHPHQPNIHHPNHPQAPKQEDFADQPYHGVIHMITGGSSIDFDTKRQKRDHYRSINHVAVTGPVVQTKWSHVSLTFDARDVDLRSAPHMDTMVIHCSVAGWDLHKVLVDNGSQADIIFLQAFGQPLIWLRRQGHLSCGQDRATPVLRCSTQCMK
jgi:hypothetical protein